jgi:hypothetical protein
MSKPRNRVGGCASAPGLPSGPDCPGQGIEPRPGHGYRRKDLSCAVTSAQRMGISTSSLVRFNDYPAQARWLVAEHIKNRQGSDWQRGNTVQRWVAALAEVNPLIEGMHYPELGAADLATVHAILDEIAPQRGRYT